LLLTIPAYAASDSEPAWWIASAGNVLPLAVLLGIWLVLMRGISPRADRKRWEEHAAPAELHMGRVEKLLEEIADNRNGTK